MVFEIDIDVANMEGVEAFEFNVIRAGHVTPFPCGAIGLAALAWIRPCCRVDPLGRAITM